MSPVGALDPDLEAAALRWAADDVDDGDRRELHELLVRAREEDAARDELASRFSAPLEFGTAGLRGAMAAGPARMNPAVVIRAAAGLGAFLREVLRDAQPAPLVVIGFDARHRSHDLAQDSAAVLTAAGLRVLLSPAPAPTPLLAFAVRHLGADAGIMVTASHNPAADNGYKVYLGGRVVTGPGQGAQIVPPYDGRIADRIAQAPPANAVPRATSGWRPVPEAVREAYLAGLPGGETAADLRIVTTAMHGVGDPLLGEALRRAGFRDVHPVPQQQRPDPDFPTVAFPNPEEPGALDLALDLARSQDADLVLAVDPDADRCAVAVRDPHAGGWRRLHGDEVGSLLGEEVAAARDRAAPPRGVLASSIVSSRLLSRIAADHGLEHRATLTGFKWIARVDDLVLGYEEAIGYCVDPARVRDKDGVSAAVAVARLSARLAAEGRGLVDVLDDLARRHGLYLTDQVSVRFAEPSPLGRAVARLLDAPPPDLAGSPVVRVRDLSKGLEELPPTTGVELLAEDDTRVVVRPSGTEPRVKAYLEVVEPAPGPSSEAVGRARAAARARLDQVAEQVQGLLLGSPEPLEERATPK